MLNECIQVGGNWPAYGGLIIRRGPRPGKKADALRKEIAYEKLMELS